MTDVVCAAPLCVSMTLKPTMTDDGRESPQVKKRLSCKKGACGLQLGRIQYFTFQSFSQSANTC